MTSDRHRKAPSFVAATAMMANLYIRTLLRGRKTWLVAALIVIGLAVAVLVTTTTGAGNQVNVYKGLLGQMTFGFMIPFCALFYGTAVVREEVESRTFTYLLVRPLPRISILLGRWLAAVIGVVILMVAFTAAIHLIAAPAVGEASGGLGIGGAPVEYLSSLTGLFDVEPLPTLGVELLAAALGAAYYTTIFTVIAALLPRPLLFGLGYIIFWEFSLPMVPNAAATLSMKFHLLNLVGLTTPSAIPLLGPTDVTFQKSLMVLVIATIVLAIVALVVFPRKEYVLSAD